MFFRGENLPLLICGEKKRAWANVRLIDDTPGDILLIVQVNNELEDVDRHAQLIAEAVAAFNESNVQRELVGHPPLEGKVNRFVNSLTSF